MELIVTQHAGEQKFDIEWIEVNTTLGNRVIQEGHAPLIVALKKDSPVIFLDKHAGQQTLQVASGILSVNRNHAILVCAI